MLVLFDVDATLITTGRAGIRAIGRAGRRLHGDGFDESRAEYAGRLDPLILHDVLRGNGVEPSAAAVEQLRVGYTEELEGLLREADADGPGTGRVGLCPGVGDLLDALRIDAWSSDQPEGEIVLGLLTGNYEQSGRVKLRACGVDTDAFPVRVWGNDSPSEPASREQLPGVGMSRCVEITGRVLTGHEVVIIGDTPNDISCARAHGCRVIGVATGHSSVEELSAADLAVPTLEETERLVTWIKQPASK